MAAELNPSALCKRNKRHVATLMKQEWKKNKIQKLNEFLDYLLNPLNQFDNFETIDWCRFLVSGGETFEEFSKKVKQYDTAISCGLVWTADFVAYRCRTCGISPCMSLCNECFQAGNHEGHDYNMFRSQAGGACDCGDIFVMDPAGFCPRHGPSRECEAQHPPRDLLAMAEIMMPKLFQYFLLYLRDNWKPDMKGQSQNLMMADAEQYLGFLHSLSDMGAAMRHIITATLINPELYPVVSTGQEGPHKAVFIDRCKNYLAAIQTSTLPKEFVRLHYKYGISTTLKHQTLLDELVFWMMKYEFPERIVTLLLGLLPDNDFKEAFVHAFIMHYTRISVVLVNALERPKVANRVLHISVQLFSNESLSCQMADKCRLLYIVVIALYYMVQTCKIHCTMEKPERQPHSGNYHYVVDCASDVMKDHCYWPIISDVINLLQHRMVALKFMTDHNMVNLWMELLSFLQGMNINQRELVQHIQFEPDTYYAAFSAELEVSASPLWCLLAHCRTKETSRCVLNLIAKATTNLEEWFVAVNLAENSKMHPFQLTFHLPLHRYLALAIMQAVKTQQVEFSVLPLETDFLSKALIHVLQVQVGLTEILSGMWVRNGLQMKGQAMTYIQSHFSYSMADADIFLLQMCACKLDPDYFVNKVLEKFHIQNLLSSDWDNCHETVPLTLEQRLAMVEGALTLFVNMIDLHTYLGIEDKDLMRLEMVSLLCMADRQHSALQDHIPEKAGLNAQGKEFFDPLLEEIAEYKAPHFLTEGGLQQGTYVPKGFLWEQEFDPVHVLQRAIYRRDYQAAMDRYTEYLRRNRLYTKKSAPWPPFRAPRRVMCAYEGLYRILNCPAMHTFLFFILHKSLEMFAQMPESILYNTIHLLDLALCFRSSADTSPSRSQSPQSPPAESKWLYHGNCLVENVCKVIQEIPEVMRPASSYGKHPHTVSTDMEASSLEEMFMVAPSTIITTSGPIVAAHSGVTPSYHSLSLSSQPGTSADPSTSSQYKQRLVEGSHESGQHGPVQVNESIVSLLMKLHGKLSDKGSTYVPPSLCNRKPNDSLYGDGPHFIGQLLDRLIMTCSNCEDYICQIHSALHPEEEKPEKASSSTFLDAEERQKKARERQKKLLAQFASRQKAFMEKATQEGGAVNLEEEEPQESCEDDVVGEQTYECVICNERTPSLPEDPIGLAVFLQATSILGHRQQVDASWRQNLGEERPKDFPSCAFVQSRNMDVLFNNFEEHSCQQSVSIGWEGGVLVETCGHYLHLRCHRSYITSLRTQNYGNLAVQKGEYWCPVCRQLSNSVVPIVPEESKYSVSVPVSQNVRQLACDIGMMLMNRQSHAPSKSADALNKAMADIMDDLTQATYPAFKKWCTTQSTESFLLFICSIARTNLELELLQRGGIINESPAPAATKKLCFLPLMHVLSLHCHILNFHAPPNHVMWTHITGIPFNPQPDSLAEYSKEVPLLLRDPTALLIQFVLTLPLNIATECFDLLVRMLYNIAYVQALCVTSCSFAAEEREAWRSKGAKLPLDTMEGMLSFVIERLTFTQLYEHSMESDQHPAISQSVWSPQSVQSLVEEHMLPYLRVAALLKQHLYGRISSRPSMVNLVTPRSLAGQQQAQLNQTEYQFLCQSFGMEEGGSEVWKNTGRMGTPCPLTWAVPDAQRVPRGWFDHLANFINTKSSEAKMLMMSKPMWFPPCLVQLPREYYAIFEQFRQHTCPRCNSQPKEPALCLVCGQFLCFRDTCCKDSNIYECVQHSITCGAGTGMFLLVVSSIVVVIRGPRAALWGCIHLDEHGEEDRDLKRGRPLYLSKERYSLLQNQWLAHSFDHTCKKWIWHKDRL